MNQYEPETKFLPVAPTSNGSQSKEELDRAGQAVVLIIGKAAEAATSRADQARDVAQKLSSELAVTEKRVRELEAEISHYRDRTARAEDWLLRVSKEIEDQFFSRNGGARP